MTLEASKTKTKFFEGTPPAFLLLGLVVLLPLTFPSMHLSTWVNLTVNGLTMAVMVFTMAVGLTLIFGLMDVMNFAHGAFITVGAYVAASLVARLAEWGSPGLTKANIALFVLAIAAALVATALLGYLFEKIIVRPVYGAPMKQILITMGGLIVAEQLFTVIWGVDAIPLPRPAALDGAFIFGEIVLLKFRLAAALIGIIVYIAIHLALNRTRLGLLIRAGVENPEMVEALGYRIRRLFILVFILGSALAGVGGVLWGMNEGVVSSHMGTNLMLLTFIVIIIGGLGSVGGCLFSAVLVGLTFNYVAYLAPILQLGSNIFLMILILMWRPRGLFPTAKT